MNQLLKVENLEKGQILNGVSFVVEQGAMTAVMGPSGSGKSTLLYHAAGMDRPSGGKVWLKETEITNLSEDERSRVRLHRMGFVFQQMNMLSNLNILDNILLPVIQANKDRRSLWEQKVRRSKAELTRTARELMRKLSIAGLEERSITQVSGGQLQRACICRSMMNAPEILFADEPTGALNKSAAAGVMEELVRLNEDGTTILLVTHDSKVASRCGRILYLSDGRICGELELGKPVSGEEKQREDRLNRWLMEMGW